MRNNVLKMPGTTETGGARARLADEIDARKRCASFCSVVVPLIAAAAGFTFLSLRRALHHDRQRLCRRAEGADHAGHLRQDQHHLIVKRRPACAGRRSAVRDRSGAVPARADAGAEQARSASAPTSAICKTNLTSLTKLVDIRTRRASSSSSATSSASRRWSPRWLGIAGRSRHRRSPALVTAQLQAQHADSAEGRHLQSVARAILICRSRNSRPTSRPKAALDQAQRDLNHTTLRAPMSGTATQVDAIQLGRFVTAGTPVFSVIDDSAPWVDANPKETDITYLRIGQNGDARCRLVPRPHLPRHRAIR